MKIADPTKDPVQNAIDLIAVNTTAYVSPETLAMARTIIGLAAKVDQLEKTVGTVMTPTLADAISATIAQSVITALESHGIRAEQLAREIGENGGAAVVFLLHEQSVVDAARWALEEATPPCRCDWTGIGPHLCHRCGKRPGSARYIAEKACVVIPGKLPRQPTLGSRETWSCDSCWEPYAADGTFRGE